MKRKWNHVVKDYLTFTLKDRISLLLLTAIIIILIFAPRYFKKETKPFDNSAFQRELAGLQITIDSSKPYNARRYDNDEEGHYSPSPRYIKEAEVKGELFAFDPNTLDAAGWKRLGLRDRTIETIIKFVGKGYTFKKPEDLKKIFGLKPADADRLIPYVEIAQHEKAAQQDYAANKPNETFAARPSFKTSFKIIDVNDADTSAFIALPGIGSKLALRIVNFREKLGGFHSSLQVAETFALPDSTFQKIKNSLTCKTPVLKTININTVDANILKMHPYLKWNIANAIVAYRQQHGAFKSVQDIKKIDIISEELFNKVAPYLTISL